MKPSNKGWTLNIVLTLETNRTSNARPNQNHRRRRRRRRGHHGHRVIYAFSCLMHASGVLIAVVCVRVCVLARPAECQAHLRTPNVCAVVFCSDMFIIVTSVCQRRANRYTRGRGYFVAKAKCAVLSKPKRIHGRRAPLSSDVCQWVGVTEHHSTAKYANHLPSIGFIQVNGVYLVKSELW